MAKSYSVGLYRISVRKARDQKSEMNLNDPLIAGKSNFYDFFTTQLKKYETDLYQDVAEYLRLERIESTKHDAFSKIEGRVESGDNGYMSRLVNTETRASRDRMKEEAEMLPYYFCLSETNDPKRAAFCVQRFGKTGVFTTLTSCLKENFHKEFPGLVLQIDSFLPDFYVDKFISRKEVREFRYTMLTPVSDAVTLLLNEGVRGSDDVDVVIETRIRTKRRAGRLKVQESDAQNVGEMLAKINPHGVDQSKIVDKSITFVGPDGETRTFRASRPDNSALPYIDVTDEVELDEKGHPDYDGMKDAVDIILTESKLY